MWRHRPNAALGTAGVQADIWTRNLPNTGQVYCPVSQDVRRESGLSQGRIWDKLSYREVDCLAEILNWIWRHRILQSVVYWHCCQLDLKTQNTTVCTDTATNLIWRHNTTVCGVLTLLPTWSEDTEYYSLCTDTAASCLQNALNCTLRLRSVDSFKITHINSIPTLQ